MSRLPESCARELLETIPAVMRFIREAVRQRRYAGLSLAHYRTLIFVNRTKGSSLSAVAAHLGLSLPAMSRLMNGLVADRLVRREAVPTNRRRIALTLTARGRETLECVRSGIRRRLAGSLRSLAASDQEAIRRAMPALRNAFSPSALPSRENDRDGGKP